MGEKIAVYLDFHNKTLSAAAFSDGTISYYTDGSMGEKDILSAVSSILSDGSIKKYVCAIKEAIVFLNGKTEINGIDFDCSLAAYLRDPSKSYDIESLASQYLGVYIDTPDNAQLSLFDDDKTAERYGKYALIIWELQKKLAQLIKENDQESLFYNVEMPLIDVLASMGDIRIHA